MTSVTPQCKMNVVYQCHTLCGSHPRPHSGTVPDRATKRKAVSLRYQAVPEQKLESIIIPARVASQVFFFSRKFLEVHSLVSLWLLSNRKPHFEVSDEMETSRYRIVKRIHCRLASSFLQKKCLHMFWKLFSQKDHGAVAKLHQSLKITVTRLCLTCAALIPLCSFHASGRDTLFSSSEFHPSAFSGRISHHTFLYKEISCEIKVAVSKQWTIFKKLVSENNVSSESSKVWCYEDLSLKKEMPATTFSARPATAHCLPRQTVRKNISIEAARVSQIWDASQRLRSLSAYRERQTFIWRWASLTDIYHSDIVDHSKKLENVELDVLFKKERIKKAFQKVYKVWWSKLNWSTSLCAHRTHLIWNCSFECHWLSSNVFWETTK